MPPPNPDPPTVNVLYDAQIFRQQRYGGISRYFCEVAPRIGHADGVKSRILAPRHDNAYLDELHDDTLIGWKSSAMAKGVRGGRRIERAAAQLAERVAERLYRPDVVHETYYWQSPVAGKRAARVLTIYDMIHERFPTHFPVDDPTPAAKRAAAARADHIICISESTRRDVIDLMAIAPEKLTVTYLSGNLKPPPASAKPNPATAAAMPYVLYVGERGGYKNFANLIIAMASSPVLRQLRLVCFGGGGLNAADWACIDAAGFPRDHIEHRHGGDDVLANAYSDAACFVYPSLYEGFGIPPLEAMTCGCPIACSNISSIPEVVGNAGAYFDPHDAGSMAQAIESIVSSPARRSELRQLGAERARAFSWDRCASETLAVYRSLVGH